jgi:hypothetical protein
MSFSVKVIIGTIKVEKLGYGTDTKNSTLNED